MSRRHGAIEMARRALLFFDNLDDLKQPLQVYTHINFEIIKFNFHGPLNRCIWGYFVIP